MSRIKITIIKPKITEQKIWILNDETLSSMLEVTMMFGENNYFCLWVSYTNGVIERKFRPASDEMW